jgi:hypothetical protein
MFQGLLAISEFELVLLDCVKEKGSGSCARSHGLA